MTPSSLPMRLTTSWVTAGLLAASAGTAQAANDCQGGLFGVAAQIVRVEPMGSPLFKRRTGGTLERVGTNDVICAGETLEVKADGGLRSVELYTKGRKEALTPTMNFETRQGVLAYSVDALHFLAGLVGGLGDIKPPPDVPKPTAVRGTQYSESASNSLHALRGLRDLPRQNLVTGAAPVLSWRGGTGPYQCTAMSEVAEPVWSSSRPEDASWCVADGNLDRAVQLQVRDAKGLRTVWNIRRVSATQIPRPAWLAADAALSPADRTAWAAWLWMSAGAAWRLHALAMLNQLAATEWSAGYVRDVLLAESSALLPR